MTIDRTQTIASLVFAHPELARVFQEQRIDFCCRGDQTLEQYCAGKGRDVEPIYALLQAAVDERSGQARVVDYRELPVASVIETVIDRHHGYLRTQLPFLAPLAAKVARVHGDLQPELREIHTTFMELKGALEPHLDEEEAVLFPAMLAHEPDRELIGRELASMHREHLAVGTLLERLRALSGDYKVPEWACNSYRTLYAELQALEGDVLRHVHIENHVLMPRFA